MSSFAGYWTRSNFSISDDAVAAVVAAMQSRWRAVGRVVRDETLVFVEEADSTNEAHGSRNLRGSENTDVLTVVDARFDDRSSLEADLGLSNALDNEILGRAYEQWGVGCTDHLHGDFAFALWDAGRRILILSRDVLGVRPLYYLSHARGISFASDLPLLLGLPYVPRVLNDEKIADFLMGVASDPTSTFYRGIRRLPAAHSLIITPDSLRKRRYWKPDATRELRLDSDGAYAEGFRELFFASLRERLKASGAVACTLSGGLDSSSIACGTGHVLGSDETNPLDTYSMIFDDVPKSDERKYIDAVAAVPGIRSHRVRADLKSPFESLDRHLAAFGEPLPSPNSYLAHPLYDMAKQQGVDVLLDGYFGDSVVGHGTQYLTELFASLRWVRLATEIARLTKRNARPRERPKYAARLTKQYLIDPYIDHYLRIASMSSLGRFPADAPRWLVNPDLLQHTNWRARALERSKGERDDATTVRGAQASEVYFQEYLVGFEMITQLGRSYGVTIRFPFADRRLFEYCLAVPSEQKYYKGWTRMYFRRAMTPYVPTDIVQRYGKTYMHHNFFHCLLNLGGASLEAFLKQRLDISQNYLNVPQIIRTYHHVQEGRIGRDAAWSLWNAVLLTRWLEMESR